MSLRPDTARRARPRYPARLLAPFLALLAAVAAASVCTAAGAAGEVRIGEPTDLDRRYMAQQRNDLDELAREELGTGLALGAGDGAVREADFERRRDHTIEVLQRLLDEGLVGAGDRRLLQGMGIVLGELLAEELDMHWVIYQDELGRSRALRYRATDNYLFPATMISRRREAGDLTPVVAIYGKAVSIIEPLRDPLPFQ